MSRSLLCSRCFCGTIWCLIMRSADEPAVARKEGVAVRPLVLAVSQKKIKTKLKEPPGCPVSTLQTSAPAAADIRGKVEQFCLARLLRFWGSSTRSGFHQRFQFPCDTGSPCPRIADGFLSPCGLWMLIFGAIPVLFCVESTGYRAGWLICMII